MSASVATSAVGLLDRHYSPQSVHVETSAPAWSDRMEVDRSNHGQERLESVEPNIAIHAPIANVAQADSDRRDTIGGLLAALATNATTKVDETAVLAPATAPATVPASAPLHNSASPQAPADSPISQTSDVELQQTSDTGPVNMSHNMRLSLPGLNGMFPPSAMPLDAALLSPATLIDLQSMPFNEEDMPFPPFDISMDQFPQEPFRESTPVNVKRQYDAFARLEFADGIFYLNTHQCELGRDQHAYKDALRREREAQEAAELEKHQPKSSSGKASQRVQSIKAAGSQVQGSVVSERGGFAGVDEKPIEGYGDDRNGQHGKNHSSQGSESSVVRPADLHNPSLAPFDYHKDVIYQSAQPIPVPGNNTFEDEQPAPVTADHMPDPSSCPLIPIHPTLDPIEQSEVECMKAISRRHIKIFWNFNESSFFMEVLGRNGAFFEQDHVSKGECIKLHSGARIQISAVEFTFRLPITQAQTPEDEDESSIASDEALDASPSSLPTEVETGQSIKLKLKVNGDVPPSLAAATDAEKKARRGPGRPPKNGYMSQREMKELEKAEKEKQARVTNGDPSPAVPQPRKSSKSQLPKSEPLSEAPKPEKRKYTKRKREDGEEEEVIPSIEGQEETPVAEPLVPQQTAKRPRTKSFSPYYKPHAECTAEDLARPPHNYAVLLYMVLSDTGEITLRQIYKQMQSRWPYFKYMVDSDGWTSSVRHNLNQEVGKLFQRGRKEGKGFTWLPMPNAMEEYQAQKNKRSNAPPAPRPRPPPQRPNFPPTQGQQLTWQNSGTMPQPNRPGEQGPWPPQQTNGGQPPQTELPTNGSMPHQQNGQRPMSSQPPTVVLNPNPNFVPPDNMLPHYFGRPAPTFVPVTFEGLAVIHRFQGSMMAALPKDPETQAKWAAVFDSAKKRCLHGAAASCLEGGESGEERTIMEHITTFVGRYRNPAFIKFAHTSTTSPTTTTAASNNTAGPSTGIGTSIPPRSPPEQLPQRSGSAQSAPVTLSSGQVPSTSQMPQPQNSQQAQSVRPPDATTIAATDTPTANGHQAALVQASVATVPSQVNPDADSHSHSMPTTGLDRQPTIQGQLAATDAPVSGPGNAAPATGSEIRPLPAASIAEGVATSNHATVPEATTQAPTVAAVTAAPPTVAAAARETAEPVSRPVMSETTVLRSQERPATHVVESTSETKSIHEEIPVQHPTLEQPIGEAMQLPPEASNDRVEKVPMP